MPCSRNEICDVTDTAQAREGNLSAEFVRFISHLEQFILSKADLESVKAHNGVLRRTALVYQLA
jgi:hypothetical protein